MIMQMPGSQYFIFYVCNNYNMIKYASRLLEWRKNHVRKTSNDNDALLQKMVAIS